MEHKTERQPRSVLLRLRVLRYASRAAGIRNVIAMLKARDEYDMQRWRYKYLVRMYGLHYAELSLARAKDEFAKAKQAAKPNKIVKVDVKLDPGQTWDSFGAWAARHPEFACDVAHAWMSGDNEWIGSRVAGAKDTLGVIFATQTQKGKKRPVLNVISL